MKVSFSRVRGPILIRVTVIDLMRDQRVFDTNRAAIAALTTDRKDV